MGYIIGLDVTTALRDRCARFVCKECKNVFSDTRGKGNCTVKVEFPDVKIPKVTCPICNNDTFDVSLYIEPYFVSNEFEEETTTESVPDDEENEED